MSCEAMVEIVNGSAKIKKNRGIKGRSTMAFVCWNKNKLKKLSEKLPAYIYNLYHCAMKPFLFLESPEILEKAKVEADKLKMSLGAFIRKLIHDYFKNK